ncbi:MAG: sulfatase-like hydrolase/transferase [Planctomycetota bacterium]
MSASRASGRRAAGGGGIVLLLAAALGGGGCGTDGAAPPPPSFVLLVSIDTLRADHLACYGYDRPTSPRLDAVAREGVLFEQAFSQSAQTLTSHKSIFAAKYPLTLVAEATGADLAALAALEAPLSFTVDCFAGVRESLVSAVREAGWKTAAFTDGGYVAAELGFATGWDAFNDEGGGFAGVLARADQWLAAQDLAAPTVLFLHGYDVHCPYWSRAPFHDLFGGDAASEIDFRYLCGKGGFMERELSAGDLAALHAHYDGSIASTDDYLGLFFDRLAERGLWEEALVVIFADHGESLGEHGEVGHGGLYLEQLHVPLLVKFPAAWKVPPGRIRAPVELVDVMPTVLDCLGIAPPAGIDGRSLLPILVRGAPGRRHVVAQTTFQEGRRESGGGVRYVTEPARRTILEPGRWQLVHDARRDAAELFALSRDPRGLVDLAASDPPELAHLLGALAAYDRGDPEAVFRSPDTAGLSPALREELRAIGY